jgi:CO dehydrogenase/acetyl-CoA synthase beta subunit
MATFDSQIAAVTAHVEELRAQGRAARAFTAPSSVAALEEGLPIRVCPGASPGVILRADTFVELGSPDAGSCALVLWTDAPSLVRDGRVTVIGPDIPEAPGASLPFGQVLMVGGVDLGAEEHQSLEQAQFVADQVEGYMVRSSSRNVWSRVSKDVAAKGFCLNTLGSALMLIFKSSLPKVQAMEIVFVTSGKEDLLRLGAIATEVHERGKEIVKAHWKARGFDLDCDFDCRSCEERKVCDYIREVAGARKKKTRKAAAGSPRQRARQARC